MQKCISFLAVCFLISGILSACAGGDSSNDPLLDGDSADGDSADGDSEGMIDGDFLTDGDATDSEYPDGDISEEEEKEPLDLSEPLAEGETRAGQVTSEDELIGGPMAKAKLGDYKLYNSRIRVIVESERTSDGWGTIGGSIADADIVRPEGEEGQSLFSEYFYLFGLKMQDTEKVEVINDGSNGEAAVVRFTGPDTTLPFIDAAFSDILFPTELNTTITVDYVLLPDSDLLEIHSSFTWTGDRRVDLDFIMQVFIMGDGLQNFKVGPGFDKSGHPGETDIYITAGHKVSYGFFSERGPISQMFNYEGINFYISEKQEIEPGESVTFIRYLAITDGGVDKVLRTYNSWAGVSDLGHVSGTLTAPDGSTPIAGARIHAIDENAAENMNYLNQAITGADGSYEMELPPGNYKLVPYIDGAGMPDGVSLSVESGDYLEQDLMLPELASLQFSITDSEGLELPAKLFANRTDGRIIPPASFGEFTWHSGLQRVVHSESGEGVIELPPGNYTITASRGYEYSIDVQNLTLVAGQQAEFTGIVDRVVDTAGYISSDFHIHSMASPDSDIYYEDRIRSAVSEGLEAPVSTDHDIIIDWTPAAEALGVTDWVHPVVGMEITTYTYGHFNAWPLLVDPLLPNNGAFTWYYKWAPELFAEVAEYETNPILHVCHPRSASIGGYFSSVKYDPDTGETEMPDNWSTQFDTIEIINGGNLTTALEKTLPDWYSFLNRGYRFTGASGSDTHKLTHEVGNVRNWIASDTDAPAEIDPYEMAATVRNMDMIVSTGPYVSFTIGEAGMGEDITDTDGTVELQVRVQAPLYMDVNRLTVIGNGEKVAEEGFDDRADRDDPVERYNSTIALSPAVDTWYVVIVEGDVGSWPVASKRPFAFTNPIFVDVDGNGEFDALLE